AEAVHGAGRDRGAVVQRPHGVVRPQAEVVVEVDHQGLVGKGRDQLGDVEVDAFRGEVAHGVGKRVAGAAGRVAGGRQLDQVAHVGPGAVLAPELDLLHAAAAGVG